ncbi:VRR-NUC domain-containing protein [Mangrovitalea sediminis]|uniref:VRR-NUC domain-containing protein n=1 Tax=Mangrovitalea sediminis TaxID=1982043 RepID=UPI000BE4D2E7|nr:VRR-NUC domain-containing protein [Mangrovitalea sediminis]
MNPLDDPFYYLNNFRTVLDWIEARYCDLLSAGERAFNDAFRQLPQRSQALLVRMVMRKGCLFRASRLSYVEIGPTLEAVEPLIALGWVNPEAPLTLDDLFGLLTRTELAALFRDRLSSSQGRKADWLTELSPQFDEAKPFASWAPDSDERLFALTCMPLCDRLRLMFFGNLHQDWSEFVLADLGVFRYETVAFSDASRAFRCRKDVDTYLHLHACRERLDAEEALDDIFADLPAIIADNPWLEARRAKLLFRMGQQGERTGEWETAQRLYEQSHYPGARGRCIRVLERQERYQDAFELAATAVLAPESDAERQQLERVMPRLRRKLGLPVQRPPREMPAERIDLILPPPTTPLSVENRVQAHLSTDDVPVHYVENTLINGLFGLLCWDVIFAALPGAFFHPFHTGPADLLQPDFHARRAGLFEDCFALLETDAYQQRILDTFHAKQGIQSPFVFWGALNETLLEQALTCFPADHLNAWFRRLLADIRTNRAGLPDLIQFWPDQARYRMIEVKGPGDRLQDNQRRWIDFCARHDMPVAVCYVRWQETA